MKSEIKNLSNTRVEVVCTFDGGEIATEKDSVIGLIGKSRSVPGFRPGKAPKQVIEANFGKEINEHVINELFKKGLQELDHNEEIKPYLFKTLVDQKVENVAGNAIITYVVDFVKDFEIPNYEALSIPGIHVEVSDEDVEHTEKQILKQSARYEVVGRAAEAGDYVKLNYSARMADGSEMPANMPAVFKSQTNTWEEAGGTLDMGVRAIVAGIVGMAAGDKKTVEEVLPEDFGALPEMAGKTIIYDLEVLEVRNCLLPDLTPDFLAQYKVSSEEELKNNIRQNLLQQRTTHARIQQREDLLKRLADMTTIEVSEAMINTELNRLIVEGIPEKRRERMNEAQVKAVVAELKPMAIMRAKINIVLDKIAGEKKISLEGKDIEGMIWQDINSRHLNPGKYINEIKRNRELAVDINRRALRGKTLDVLMMACCEDLKSEANSKAAAEEASHEAQEGAAEVH